MLVATGAFAVLPTQAHAQQRGHANGAVAVVAQVENVLNNSPILSGNTITAQNINVAIANASLNGSLNNLLQNALQNAHILNQDVIGVAILNNVLTGTPILIAFV